VHEKLSAVTVFTITKQSNSKHSSLTSVNTDSAIAAHKKEKQKGDKNGSY